MGEAIGVGGGERCAGGQRVRKFEGDSQSEPKPGGNSDSAECIGVGDDDADSERDAGGERARKFEGDSGSKPKPGGSSDSAAGIGIGVGDSERELELDAESQSQRARGGDA